MKLEQQVCSLVPSKRLAELGVKQESYFWWWHRWEGSSSDDAGKDILGAWSNQPSNTIPIASAFTVAELGEMLPKRCEIVSFKTYIYGTDTMQWECGATFVDGKTIKTPHEFSDTEADARAKMLIYLLENDLISPEDDAKPRKVL